MRSVSPTPVVAADVAGRLGRLSPAKRDLLLRELAGRGPSIAPAEIRRERRDGAPMPVSYAQERLWLAHQLDPEGAAYNLPLTVRLTGRLDGRALEQSLSAIVHRHEALRTTFSVVDGLPVQIVRTPPPVQMDVQELTGSLDARCVDALRLAREEAARPFDLETGPLFRTTLVRVSDDEHRLLLNMHHIVSDGWSFVVLFHELQALYDAFSTGRSSPLSELPIQYADYARWQREWLCGQTLEALLAYWCRRLDGAPPVLELRAARPRPPIQNFRGARHAFMIPPPVASALRRLARREQVTLFMVLLAGFTALLARQSGRDDLVVGTDVANRTRGETSGLIGFFVNLLALRSDLSGNPPFRTLLARTRDGALDAYAHQELPFGMLVEKLHPRRSLSYTPLTQILFVMQAPLSDLVAIRGLATTLLQPDIGTCRFDLALGMADTSRGLGGIWNYSTNLFDAGTIAALSRNYEALLARAAAEPDTRLDVLTRPSDAQGKGRSMTMTTEQRRESRIQKLRSATPTPIDMSHLDLVTATLLAGESLPLVIQPTCADVDPAEWAATSREFIDRRLLQHGAVLFRGFDFRDVQTFEKFAQAICPVLFGDYGDLPPEPDTASVYKATPYPSDRAILFHNEGSHTARWPLKQFFFCVTPSKSGGETPIVDCRKVYERLDRRIVDKFQQTQLMYVRNFIDGLDVGWREFFKTSDKSVVESYCRNSSIASEWRPSGLRISQVCPAVAKHPKTGEMSFFNQLQLHHLSCHEPSVRDALLSTFGEEGLPRNVYYGDGSPIPDEVLTAINTEYQRAAVSFPWEAGDVLLLDNMLTAHARRPYVGPRKIVVAMGEMFGLDAAQR